MDNTYAEIDLPQLVSNYRAVEKRAGKPVMAVVKADAYGHGAVAAAKALCKAGCPWFGVANLPEALELRRAGIREPILILGGVDREDFPAAVREEIRVPLFTEEDGIALSRAAAEEKKTAKFHFAVDTGMCRIGFDMGAADVCARIAALPGLEAEGLFSHFARADEADQTATQEQTEKFRQFREALKDRGVTPKICHLDNSAGIITAGAHFDMVRAGIVLYGLYPGREMPRDTLPVRPVLSWYSRVSFVKDLPAGSQVSYGGTFTAERPMRTATVAVGYADGYNRRLSNRFYVLIRGQKARILGRVCMDQIVVDVSHIPEAAAGDRVTLIGTDGGETVTADDMAQCLDTISYEILCLIGRRTVRKNL